MSFSIDGIASGFNTSELVQQLIQIERRPIVMMQQRIESHQQRMDAWRDVNMRLASLDTKLGDLLLSSTYQARTTTSSEPKVATASASTTAMPASYSIEVTQLATAHRIVGRQFQDTDSSLGLADTTVKINETDIEIAGNDSLRDIAIKINDADAKVQASIIDGRLVLESEETGSSNAISFVGSGGVFTALGLVGPESDNREAKDAEFTINGIVVTRESNTIDDVVDGVTFTLQSEGDTVIDVTKNVDGAVSQIRDVVDQINSAMQFMNSRLADKAILQGDSALMRLQHGLRTSLMDRVQTDGSFNQLAAIGITFNRTGEMEIDESKLREVLMDNPEAVYRLFAGDHDNDGFEGVARKTRALIKTYTQTDGIIANRREMFQNQITSTEDSIERLEQRLQLQEERLFRRFGAMEQALAEMQAQSAWLQTQLMQMAMMQQ